MKIHAWDVKDEYAAIEDAICETCNHCVVTLYKMTNVFHCHMRPPVVLLYEGDEARTYFPQVSANQCCGEWTKKIV